MRLSKRLQYVLGQLPDKYKWTVHNLIAHPLSEIVHLLGRTDLGNRIHDATVPTHEPGAGRG